MKRNVKGTPQAELEELRARLQEAEETIEAIRNGQVDALVVSTGDGPKVFTLEGADQRYRRLVETMNEGALLVGPTGIILYSNAAFATMMMAALEAITGRSLFDFVDSGAHPIFEALLVAARRDHVADEVMLRRPDGHPVATYLSMSPNEDGEVGVCVIVTNLTAQKRNEEILAAEYLANSILEQAAEAIIVCDRHGVVIRASRAARIIARGQALHQHVFDAFPLRPVDALDGTEHPASRAIGGELAAGVEMLLDVRAGGHTHVLCTAAPLRNDRQEVLGCVMSLTDITPQKRAEAERVQLLDAERAARALAERARSEAEASNRSKDEFLATVSHELRTPLNAIVGWASLMADGNVPEDKKLHAVDVIRRNADAQARLIEDLLDVSRIVSGKMRLDVRPLEPATVLRAVIESVRPALDAKEIRLEAMVDSEVATILGDQERLQQVVWNLLSNAAKFTPRRGRIRVTLRRVASAIEISVQDNGQGIGADFLPYVFDRFRQADGGMNRVHGGLGLGLAISRHLVELHGGRIWVLSEGEGQGCTFTVSLPRTAVQTAPQSSPPAPSSSSSTPAFKAANLANIQVLVVEDDDDSRELLMSILSECGATVTGVNCAEDALRTLESQVPHVLISDIGMPRMDGYAFIRRVRTAGSDDTRRVPALALTAYARPEDRKRALSDGFQMHLAKPVDPTELAIAVGSLARYQMR